MVMVAVMTPMVVMTVMMMVVTVMMVVHRRGFRQGGGAGDAESHDHRSEKSLDHRHLP